MHEVQEMFGKMDSLYVLNDIIQVDNWFVEVATKKQMKEKLKRGKVNQRQANVVVAVEFFPLDNPDTGKKRIRIL